MMPDWATLGGSTTDIKSSPDFDLLFRRTYEDYIGSLRTYSRINEQTRCIVLRKRSKEVYKISRIRAIVDSELTNLIYSFVGYQFHGNKLVVHFAYTKSEFRQKGFCKHILLDLERNRSNFVYTALTSKPRTFSLFKKYRMETLK